jgi:hypothetical protein
VDAPRKLWPVCQSRVSKRNDRKQVRKIMRNVIMALLATVRVWTFTVREVRVMVFHEQSQIIGITFLSDHFGFCVKERRGPRRCFMKLYRSKKLSW